MSCPSCKFQAKIIIFKMLDLIRIVKYDRFSSPAQALPGARQGLREAGGGVRQREAQSGVPEERGRGGGQPLLPDQPPRIQVRKRDTIHQAKNNSNWPI